MGAMDLLCKKIRCDALIEKGKSNGYVWVKYQEAFDLIDK
jgi:hypothetical protein